MLNEIRNHEPANARPYRCPTTIKAGDLVLIGTIPGVAVDDYNSNTGGTVFRLGGTYDLEVVAATVVSPLTGSALNQGDKIYGTGTLDSATNITHDITLSKASGGSLIGTYDDWESITSGTTGTARVKLKETP